MKKLILLFTLFACAVAIGDVQGQEETSLEDWCKVGGNTWDDSGICSVVKEETVFEDISLTIEAHERLIIKGYVEVYYGATLFNRGFIQVEGTGTQFRNFGEVFNFGRFAFSGQVFRNCENFFNSGTIFNSTYFTNGSMGYMGRFDLCDGLFMNYWQAKFFNTGTLYNVYFAPEGVYSAFYNYGVIYNTGEVNGHISGDGPIIDLEQGCYLPTVIVD